MTDGMLLAELQHDAMLREYDTLIIDEAHERSLNIDFILGHLRQLLPERPDLKVVITSATIDTAVFSEAFGHAPVLEVSGQLFPVEVIYQPEKPSSDSKEGVSTSLLQSRQWCTFFNLSRGAMCWYSCPPKGISGKHTRHWK